MDAGQAASRGSSREERQVTPGSGRGPETWTGGRRSSEAAGSLLHKRSLEGGGGGAPVCSSPRPPSPVSASGPRDCPQAPGVNPPPTLMVRMCLVT